MAEPPVVWWIGPPPPLAVTRLTRVLQLGALTAMLVWVLGYLGGLSLSPRPTAPDGSANDTSQLFNWHPLLITVAFPVLMAEAVLAYKSPLVPMSDRPHAKLYHLVLHTLALVCTVLGVVAAFKSHTLKKPTPMADLYSSHSYLGLATLSLLGFQYLLAAYSYLFPKLTLARRRALGPLHSYLGKAILVAGLATMAVGIQEKQTFVQAFAKPASLYEPRMWLPGLIQLLLLATGLAVLYHHAPPAAPPAHHHRRQQFGGSSEADGAEDAALVTAQMSETDELHFERDARHSA
ncbi:Transmembrane ascorbate ferrireductase 1 [Chlorella sorokiniana]|jgi:hypothetical protein|uniref:Transmembrane ascorbate ferrireductase 1 n=1 Tax=Chlorella sorokiniana TaxID=3076 RepID=A0A2P6TSL8_CHLSO|nr:Transmembrane ascorbate ferrireductase 1 [Chlorella sorokiniana]|eukprot:PRW57060.1 Transmembrane ascorbate ferrireductase 1 [Chlorella sorokiniana]